MRARATCLADLHKALILCPGRSDNRERRLFLADSRSEPWSAAERLFHRMLREAGIAGWKANQPVLIDGQRHYPDVVFRTERVLIEIDGREHHGPSVFERDRWRQNALVLAGWTVLRFTWVVLTDEPEEVMRDVSAALNLR